MLKTRLQCDVRNSCRCFRICPLKTFPLVNVWEGSVTRWSCEKQSVAGLEEQVLLRKTSFKMNLLIFTHIIPQKHMYSNLKLDYRKLEMSIENVYVLGSFTMSSAPWGTMPSLACNPGSLECGWRVCWTRPFFILSSTTSGPESWIWSSLCLHSK